MPDTRYLSRRGKGYVFRIAVPVALRGHFKSAQGRPLSRIVIGLGTDSLQVAQARRWPLVQEWKAKFERAGDGMSLPEIDAAAREVYHAAVANMAKFPPDETNLDLLTFAYEDALSEELGNPDLAKPDITEIERRTGRTLEPDSKAYYLLASTVLRANLFALYGHQKAREGRASEEPATFLGAHGIDARTLRPITGSTKPRFESDGFRFAEAAKAYMAETQRDASAKLTEHTRKQSEFVFGLFETFTDNAPLAAVDKRTAAQFLDHVAAERSLTDRTLNRYCSALSAVWTWADKRGHYDGRNPFKGQWRDQGKGTGWRAFEPDELAKLFQSMPPKSGRDFATAMAWVPLVALYSGMRSNEICQLKKADVAKRQGVWCFHVRAGDGQQLKTEAAERLVPVHSELTRHGFLDYWRSIPSGELWPALKPGGPDGKLNWYFTKRFVAYRRKCGVDAPRVCFHSLRKNVAQALKDARATPAEIAELIGHEQGFTLATYAPLALPVDRLQELIERVRYSGIAPKGGCGAA